MSGRSFAGWALAALIIGLSTANPVYRALVLLCALNVIVAWRRHGASIRPLATVVAVAAGLATLITVAVSHTGRHVLVAVPDAVPVLGGPVTLEALMFGLTSGLGIAVAVFAAAPLSLALEPHDIIDAVPAALARTGAAIGTALNLVPGLGRSAAEIRDAQRMRGWRAGRIREWPDLAVPVMLTALEHSLQLAEAMEARGFGTGPRTRYAPRPATRSGSAAACVALAGAAGFLALHLSGLIADWYPFPTLSLPPVEALGVACCLTLLAPALVPRR